MRKPAFRFSGKRRLGWVLAGLALLSALGVGTVLLAGTLISAPVPRIIGPPPPDLQARAVSFPSRSGSLLHGWLIPQAAPKGGVILLHGVRADRRSMLGRARLLSQQGYAVLLFDFQAHGESQGRHMTFGYLESQDAQAALELMRQECPGQKIAVLGTSLGGAACLLGQGPLAADAMILEAVYPDIKRATINRINRLLPACGPLLAPMLLVQMKPRLGVAPAQLRPVEAIAHIKCPLLLIAGQADRHTLLAESEQLYAAAPAPKELWAIGGAAHIDFYQFAKPQYDQRVLEFLDRTLRKLRK